MRTQTAFLTLLRATAVALIAFAVNPGWAAEADYPTRPIKIVVPFAAGGGVDVSARLLGQYMTQKWGQQVIVENHPGAGGVIAARYTAAAAPDGYTLFLSAAGEIAINPFLNKNAGYDPEKDLKPVAIVVRAPNVLVINNDIPANNVAELIAYGRQHPGELTYSSSGIGTIQHITGAMFADVAKIDMRHISYPGAAPATVDVASKRVSMTFASPGAIRPFVQKGQLKMLAVVMSQRYPNFPNLPTVKEIKGMESYDVESWFAMFAPGATPDWIVQKLNTELRRETQLPEVRNQLLETAGMPSMESAEETRSFVRSEIQKYHRMVQQAKITLE